MWPGPQRHEGSSMRRRGTKRQRSKRKFSWGLVREASSYVNPMGAVCDSIDSITHRTLAVLVFLPTPKSGDYPMPEMGRAKPAGTGDAKIESITSVLRALTKSSAGLQELTGTRPIRKNL